MHGDGPQHPCCHQHADSGGTCRRANGLTAQTNQHAPESRQHNMRRAILHTMRASMGLCGTHIPSYSTAQLECAVGLRWGFGRGWRGSIFTHACVRHHMKDVQSDPTACSHHAPLRAPRPTLQHATAALPPSHRRRHRRLRRNTRCGVMMLMAAPVRRSTLPDPLQGESALTAPSHRSQGQRAPGPHQCASERNRTAANNTPSCAPA